MINSPVFCCGFTYNEVNIFEYEVNIIYWASHLHATVVQFYDTQLTFSIFVQAS